MRIGPSAFGVNGLTRFSPGDILRPMNEPPRRRLLCSWLAARALLLVIPLAVGVLCLAEVPRSKAATPALFLLSFGVYVFSDFGNIIGLN